jgi:hypothetical protein
MTDTESTHVANRLADLQLGQLGEKGERLERDATHGELPAQRKRGGVKRQATTGRAIA